MLSVKRCLALLMLTVLLACNNDDVLFKKLDSRVTGIQFNNIIVENDSINPIDLEFLYNGGGVAVGDFNHDGLPDLYFTASTGSNKLYQNNGGLHFTDITNSSGVTGEGRWSSSAAVVDINNDGWDDIYVCASIKEDAQQRKNLLYINRGVQDKKGYPVFTEQAAEYGLADTSFSVVAAFSDLDNDGDLDMFLVTTKLAKRNSVNFNKNVDSSRTDVDRLFINRWDSTVQHPVFTEVSRTAGINEPGYGLGLAIADINQDGWKDIYVTNDFYGSDNLYINNKDGTFSNKISQYLKHTSENAMGVAIADINNDGLGDILSVDMNPEDNYRKKKNMNSGNYYIFQSMVRENLALQYVRNTLQLNMGAAMNAGDSVGEPVFADVSFLTNTAETDWSWNPSIADFNNDGKRDIIITNGYPRDVTDHDFVAFRTVSQKVVSKKDLIDEMPVIKVPNYAYQNKGNLQFENVTEAWGLNEPSFSNGAVAVDLDNDGDLDYVVNNINETAFLYENTLNPKEEKGSSFLQIKFEGGAQNKKGIGAIAEVYCGGVTQVHDNQPCTGYLSYVAASAHFGLDTCQLIDSVVIRWPNHLRQTLKKVKANQLLTVKQADAQIPDDWTMPVVDTTTFFTDVTAAANITYTHTEDDFIDFDKERLLPHKLSQYGPGLAVADVDGNGLDDLFVGGSAGKNGAFLLQQPNGTFLQKTMDAAPGNGQPENLGVLFFDADNDGDADLWCAAGSNEYAANTRGYADHFYKNDGKGNFTPDTAAIPLNYTSKSCVRAADYDNDGDLDLFIGGRCLPGSYPMPVSSFIYRNDTKNGVVRFTDVTAAVCADLQNIGMVCDALWTDWNNDGNIDLVLAGEWMPITFLENKNGKFINATAHTGIAQQTGWWNSLVAGDFDGDGDMDYIAGNLGTNSFFRASAQYPARVYAKDFDDNGNLDAVVTMYLKDGKGKVMEYPALSRDDLTGQMPALKKKFLSYKSFALADIRQVLGEESMRDALVLEATNFASSYIENKGNGNFAITALPVMAQLAPINGMVANDVNGDGNLDVVMCGNDWGNEVSAGRYDALNGLVLLGDGEGNFTAQTTQQSGFFVPGDAKALIELRGNNGQCLLAASQNRGPIKVFKTRKSGRFIQAQPGDTYAEITGQNGKMRRHEFYYGSGFLSQSARYIWKDDNIKAVTIFNTKGEKRVVN